MNKKLKLHGLTVFVILFFPIVLLAVLYYSTTKLVEEFLEKSDG